MIREGSAHSPVLRGLATNPALPDELLDRLAAIADPELCLDLADRDDLTLAQARRLAANGASPAARWCAGYAAQWPQTASSTNP